MKLTSKTNSKSLLLISLLAGMTMLAACNDKGPAEKAGEQLDSAIENVKDSAEDTADAIEENAEQAADDIEDAVE